MRLTLRTLLAYLDDTLEPSEIKRIGQKVAESETAQELIARIKQITRRRRITTPPLTGPNAFDPNLVADYLDNELTAEQLAELETICLESDVHLAEVASCHQILTLVLGEPALVPPTAKERMYSLVHGREAIPFRKAATAGAHGSAPTSADADADEMFLLGLPFYRRGSWLRWALPLAGVVLLAGLGIALWQSISGINHPSQVVQTQPKPDPIPVDPKVEPPPPPPKKDNSAPPDKVDNAKPDHEQVDPPVPTPSVPNLNTSPEARKAPPSTERVEVGSYYFDPKSLPSILVRRKNDEDSWHRLKAGARVSTEERLVSLPGYASEVRLNNGVRLLLRGHIKEFSMFSDMDYLQESAVVLHKPKGVDTDLTLERGRLYLSNHKDKDAAVVRVRFNAEVWDLTLQPGAEAVIDLLRRYRNDINYMDGEEPVATLYLLVLKGKAGLAVEYQQYPDLSAPPGPASFVWDNKGGGATGPNKVDKIPPFFAEVLPVSNKDAEGMELALKQLSLAMGADKDPTVVLDEVLQKPTTTLPQHKLAIYCLGALDEVKKLIGILGDQDPLHFPDRATSIFTLRRWLGRDATQGPKLFNMKTMSGLLLSASQEFKTAEAETLFVLLHDFSEEARNKPETYELLARYLQSDKVAIAELARFHVVGLSHTFGVDLPALKKFNAAMSVDAPERELAVSEVKEAIKDGKLPPRTVLKTPGGNGPKLKTEPKPKK